MPNPPSGGDVLLAGWLGWLSGWLHILCCTDTVLPTVPPLYCSPTTGSRRQRRPARQRAPAPWEATHASCTGGHRGGGGGGGGGGCGPGWPAGRPGMAEAGATSMPASFICPALLKEPPSASPATLTSLPCPALPLTPSECSGEPDAFMDEIPTVVVDPLPAEYQAIAAVGWVGCRAPLRPALPCPARLSNSQLAWTVLACQARLGLAWWPVCPLPATAHLLPALLPPAAHPLQAFPPPSTYSRCPHSPCAPSPPACRRHPTAPHVPLPRCPALPRPAMCRATWCWTAPTPSSSGWTNTWTKSRVGGWGFCRDVTAMCGIAWHCLPSSRWLYCLPPSLPCPVAQVPATPVPLHCTALRRRGLHLDGGARPHLPAPTAPLGHAREVRKRCTWLLERPISRCPRQPSHPAPALSPLPHPALALACPQSKPPTDPLTRPPTQPPRCPALPAACRPAAFPFFYIEPRKMKRIIDRFNPKQVPIEQFDTIGGRWWAPAGPAGPAMPPVAPGACGSCWRLAAAAAPQCATRGCCPPPPSQPNASPLTHRQGPPTHLLSYPALIPLPQATPRCRSTRSSLRR